MNCSWLFRLERFYKLKDCVLKALIDLKININFTDDEITTLKDTIALLAPIKLTVESLCCENTDSYKADIVLEFMFEELAALPQTSELIQNIQ